MSRLGMREAAIRSASLRRAVRPGLAFSFCLALGLHGASGATLFGLVDTGELFASTDGGGTWTVLSTLAVSDGVGISATETSDTLVLVTRSGVLHGSTDAGVSWVARGAASASNVVDILVRPDGDILLLTETGDLWRSGDGGASFTAVAALTAPNHVSLAADELGNLYVLTGTGEVLRSDDEAASWRTAGVVSASEAVEIRFVGSRLYVLTGAGEIAESSDQGVTWITVGVISQVHMSSLTGNDGDLVAATQEGLIASSFDGSTWSWVGSINQLSLAALGNDTPTVSGVPPEGRGALHGIDFSAPWPNPGRAGAGSANFSFRLPRADVVSLELFDITGRRIARRACGRFPEEGAHTVNWALGDLSSGVYLVRLATGEGLKAERKLTVSR